MKEFISQPDGFLHTILHDFYLSIGLSFEGLDVTVGTHEWKEGPELVEQNIELISGFSKKARNIGPNE